MLKNTKKVFSIILAVAVVAMSMFTGVVVSAADPVTTAHGTVDLLEFGDYLVNDLGSTSKWYDNKLADNGETGTSWDDAIIIDSAEELVYLCKASGDDTIGKYYKVADGIAGFDLTKGNIDFDGTLAENLEAVKGSGKNHTGNTPGFQGHFDGNGATVYGAWTNHTEGNVSAYAGLFSCTQGDVTIKNINVKFASFTAKIAVGGIIGYHVGDGTNTLTIENCSVTESHIEYVGSTGFGHGIGAIVGYSTNLSSWKESDKGVDGNGDGDMADTIYVNGAVNIKNCYVNLDKDYFISCLKFGEENARGCHGGVAGFINTNAMSVSDCVVIGITPYATSASTEFNDVQHSGLESHFTNVYTTSDVAITEVNLGGNGDLANRNFTGKIFPLSDAQLKGAAAVENMDLDWSVWMADEEGYPELANAHKNVTLVDKEDGTHAATCACGFGGIAVDHNFVNGECACGAELNCATRKTITWDGSVATGIATGSGTKDAPYIIKSAAELAWLVQQKADVTTDKYYKIDDSIGAIVLQSADKAEAIMALDSAAATKAYFEAGTFTPWKTMGWEMSCFAGYFDGNGATIYGLYAPSIYNAALFSTVDGGSAFRNIAIKNSYLVSEGKNYQVGALIGTTSSAGYGAKRQGIVWVSDVVIANNYMYNNAYNPSNNNVEHLRSGIIGGVQEAMHVENCLAYGNDATYNDGYKMPLVANVSNSIVPAATHYDGFEPKIFANEETGEILYYNVVRNTVVLGADIMNTKDGRGWRKNDPDCFDNCYTDGASGTVAFTNGEWTYNDEQIKAITEEDLPTLELGDAFINTDSYPELKAFHDAVFAGDPTANGAAGHAASCSCGLADSDIQEHVFVSDEEVPEWDSYYCEVCGYVCEHEDGVEENFEADCVTAAGYTFDCELCGYHEESFDEIAGHNFTVHEAEAGADCQTAGTIAYKSCDVCEKNYAADAADTEPFENAITDITGELGECVPATDPDTGDVIYEKDGNNHWTVCSVCEEPIETETHDGEIVDNGDGTHSVTCEICGYASDAEPHHFVSDTETPEWDSYYCEVCGLVCEHVSEEEGITEYEGDCVTAAGYEYNCPICGYHEESFEEVAGHNFTVHEAEVGPDCQTPGTVAHKHCDVCDKDYAADASDTEAFENALTDLSGEVGACVELTDEEGNLVYGYDKDAHWTVCALCGEPVVTTEHNLEDGPCEICGAVKVIAEEINNVDKTGIYTIIPSDAEDYDMATDVVVYNKLGEVVLYNAKLGGFPLVKGQVYLAVFAEDLELPYDVEVTATLVVTKLFPDTSAADWYSDAVSYALGSGIMSGYASNGKFGTTDSIKRQDFILMLARYAGVDLDTYKDVECTLTDVQDGAYYEAAINWALAEGVTTGYDNGEFGVGDKMTREQIVTFLYRYAQAIGVDVTVDDGAAEALAAQYADFGKVSSFSKEAIVWALETGVISGKNPTTIAPQGSAQRCQVAQIMYNIFLNETFVVG